MQPKEHDVLQVLDKAYELGFEGFVMLGHPYSYLIDSRLNVFRKDDKWAMAIEKLGYNPRGGSLELGIFLYGNCLQNLETYNGQTLNSYSVLPLDSDQFEETTDGEALSKNAKFWLVRGEEVMLSHDKEAYEKAGIGLKEYEPGEIGIEEAARLVVIKHADLFRATDEELYKSIPMDLEKILVLNEWYHKDSYQTRHQPLSEKQIRESYQLSRIALDKNNISYEQFAAMIKKDEEQKKKADEEEWLLNRPSAYETWQQLAKVIVTGDVSSYKPSLKANTHWTNYPDSGSL